MAIAAKHALVTGRAHRVFILDWDIHHGNGIQDLTYDDPAIFYCSIHRGGSTKDQQYFYPGTGKPSQVGNAGTNLNIAWPTSGMGDPEYHQAMERLVLPVMQHFKPDLILVACGLDAVKGDLIGDCGLSRDMYHHMTRMLMEAAPTVPMVVALEGGYNVEESAACMECIAMALSDEPLPQNNETHSDQGPPVKRRKKSSKSEKHSSTITASQEAALHSIQRSTKALQRQGGTCVSGCHYKCHHTTKPHALPLKKRKSFPQASTTIVDEGLEEATLFMMDHAAPESILL